MRGGESVGISIDDLSDSAARKAWERLPEASSRKRRVPYSRRLQSIRRQYGGKKPDVREGDRSGSSRGKCGAVPQNDGEIAGGKLEQTARELFAAFAIDSKKEARRYDALVLLLRTGKITDLKLQPEFTLIEAYTTPDGERVRALRYRADFSYKREGVLIVEDVKSTATRTRTYLDKRKLMREIHGIEVKEVQDW